MKDTAVKKFVDACRNGDVPMASQLIDEGVDINDKYRDLTGLMEAVMHRNGEIVNMLLACPDIDVNIRDEDGDTALYLAMYMANTEAVGKLLSRGDTRLDITHYRGYTVLHFACSVNKEEYVLKILAHPSCSKAIVNMKDLEFDVTAETVAERMGHHGCVEMIREYLGNDVGQDEEDVATGVEQMTLDSSPQTGSRSALVPECPVCYERMMPPRNIYTCGNGHVICSDCKARMNETGNFRCTNHCGARYTGRATTVEQMIREIMGTM